MRNLLKIVQAQVGSPSFELFELDTYENHELFSEIKCLLCLLLQDPIEAVQRIASFLQVPYSEQLVMDIVDKCSFSGMKLANENIKFDFVHNTKPNPEFENPGMLYRKGKYIFRYKNTSITND